MTTTRKTIKKVLKKDKKYIIVFSVFAFLFLFFTSKMSPLYPLNEWSDVNVYFNIGKAMMNGRTLYTETFDHKGPLIFMIYGIGYLIANTSFTGIFIIQVLCWIALLYAIFKTARLYLPNEFAVLVAIFTPLFLLNYTHTGGSPEEFILIFSTISLYFFCRFYKNKDLVCHSPRVMFLHGVLVSATFLIKLNLLVFWMLPLSGILLCLFLAKNYANIRANILAFIFGFLFVALPIIIYLMAFDALKEAYEIYIVFNKKYGGVSSWGYTLTLVKERGYDYVMYHKLGALLSLLGGFVFPFLCLKNRIGIFVWFFTFAAMFFMIFTSHTFHFYYPLSVYVFVMPGLLVVASIVHRILKVGIPKAVLGLLLVCVLLLGTSDRNLYGYDADILLRRKSPTAPQFAFAETISKEKNPVLVNLGFGLGNSIFTLCNIVPQHKYFLTPNIYYNMYPDIRDSQTGYIARKEADFLVFDNFAFNYEYFKDLDILHQNYELVQTFENSTTRINETGSVYYLYKKRQ